ncbi:MAG: YggT family protein [Anaerolineae bacterium]|nr:YggT family protein [Anaerolineae bacterium]
MWFVIVNWLINLVFGLWMLVLALRVILPWLRVPTSHPVMHFIAQITDPILRPLHRFSGRSYVSWGGNYIDLLPLMAIFLLLLIQAALQQILRLIAFPPVWILRPGADFGYWLAKMVNLLFQLYNVALLLRLILEWLAIPYTHPFMRFVYTITEPLLAPIRRRLPLFAGVDISYIVAVLVLLIVRIVLVSLVQLLF